MCQFIYKVNVLMQQAAIPTQTFKNTGSPRLLDKCTTSPAGRGSRKAPCPDKTVRFPYSDIAVYRETLAPYDLLPGTVRHCEASPTLAPARSAGERSEWEGRCSKSSAVLLRLRLAMTLLLPLHLRRG
jgi:hypothetical protein